MTSRFQKEDERLLFTPESPHFFKIILEQTIRDAKLGIPRKFVEKYGNGLPSLALLQVPSGAVWQVELSKCDGRIWLQKGWQEFVDYYSLRKGHFLVFRYERNNCHCHFHVLIFDMSASEIEYPFTKLAADKYFDSDGTEARGIGLKNVNEGFDGLQPSKRIRRGMDNGWKCPEKARILSFVLLTAEEKARALQIANAFKSENPFFLAVIRPPYISGVFRMGIPSEFTRKYLKKLPLAEAKAILCVSDRKTWSVQYYISACNGKTSGQFSCGWREFALSNNLKVGDVCVFELLKGTEILLKVDIRRAGQDA